MTTYWEVKILSYNGKGKTIVFKSSETNLLNAVRAVTTYKPKRNYIVYDYQIIVVDKIF